MVDENTMLCFACSSYDCSGLAKYMRARTTPSSPCGPVRGRVPKMRKSCGGSSSRRGCEFILSCACLIDSGTQNEVNSMWKHGGRFMAFMSGLVQLWHVCEWEGATGQLIFGCAALRR